MPSPTLRVIDRISRVPAAAWDALLTEGAEPFLRHAFLLALEESGCAAPRAGWRPRHLLLSQCGRLVAAAPAYVKEDSDGDFSRDFDWASAAARARLRWYPKLVVTVPFTPVGGRRLLTAPGLPRAPLVRALVDAARALAKEEKIATVHVLFPREEEAGELAQAGMALRVSHQFHWVNRGYASMDAFLARFPSKRRAMLRREMAAPAAQGIGIRTVRGAELAADAERWARAMHALHAHTVDQLMWGRRWLNEEFYLRAFAGLPGALEVVAAERGGKVIAGAFNAVGGQRIFGRYWGCFEQHPFLHFNVCLYHSIAECIALGREAFEGGAGGEHKLARGFEPAVTWSAHAGVEGRLDAALRQTLAEETPQRRAAIERFRAESGIFKREQPQEGLG